MSTQKKGLSLSGFLASADPMTKYSDCAWSDSACNNNLNVASSTFLTAGELNLMSRFSSLNSSLTLNSAADSDATSSSTSSSSVTNNSSNSLSISPSVIDQETTAKQASFATNTNNNRLPTYQASSHLLELQKEIKEEEEEIFADINSLINGHSHLYSSLIGEDLDDDIEQEVNLEDIDDKYNIKHNSTFKQNCNNNNIHHHHHQSNHKHERLFSSNTEDDSNYRIHDANDSIFYTYESCKVVIDRAREKEEDEEERKFKLPSDKTDLSVEFAHQDDDPNQFLPEQLEELQRATQNSEDGDDGNTNHMDEQTFAACNQVDQQDYEKLQAVIQQVTSNLPKPCVFFLEGNCRRSDCKYSHDLSNITCKYWIEGFCFKGELCPFSHSYTPLSDSQDLDEDAVKSLAAKQLDPTFAIESEADFPSLPLDAPQTVLNFSSKSSNETDAITTTIKNQILSSKTSVMLKTAKKKRKRG